MKHPALQELRRFLRRRSACDLSAEESAVIDNLELVFIVCHKTIRRPIEEDDVQAALVALLQAVRTYQEGMQATFNTYASSCIRNALIKRWKRFRRLKRGWTHRHERLHDGLSRMEQEDDWQIAYTSLMVLDRGDLSLVARHYLSEVTFDDIARASGVSRQAIYDQFKRAMKDVRTIAAALSGN